MAAAKKKEKKPIMSCASSRHITKLKQSIFCLLIPMVTIYFYILKSLIISLPFKLVHFKEQKICFALLNSSSLEQFMALCEHCLKARLHECKNCSKLVHFKEQKYFLHSYVKLFCKALSLPLV